MLKKSQIKFLLYFAVVFLFSFTFLYLADLVPASLQSKDEVSFRTLWDETQGKAIREQLERNSSIENVEEPTRIVIDKIGVDTTISNPNTTSLATLDDYLLRGAVRYPGSGLLGIGNMFIFAHSTGFKVVNNQAFKAFNGLKNLTSGDIIKVYSGSKTYSYRVTSVSLVDQNAALVEFDNDKNMLTLSTCNSFGEKGDRYVVQADYIGVL